MDINYHMGKLGDAIYNNHKAGMIDKHLKALENKLSNGELRIDSNDIKVFKKIAGRMRKYNKGFWQKENWEYKILYYSLSYLINIKV